MKVVIDNAIPYIQGVLEPYAEVLYRPGASFSADDVRDADALIIRTRTRCSRELLDSSSVKLIATATIGFDHIDLDYCRRRGIEVVTAAGCNAAGVLQWVSAALAMLAKRDGWQPQQRTLGIVGVGNVGKLQSALRTAPSCQGRQVVSVGAVCTRRHQTAREQQPLGIISIRRFHYGTF